MYVCMYVYLSLYHISTWRTNTCLGRTHALSLSLAPARTHYKQHARTQRTQRTHVQIERVWLERDPQAETTEANQRFIIGPAAVKPVVTIGLPTTGSAAAVIVEQTTHSTPS